MSARRPAQTGQTTADVLRRAILKAKRRPVGQEILCAQLTREGISHATEVALIPGRRWRWDVVHPAERPWLAVEVQGGVWLGGAAGHTSGRGATRDLEKLNAAQLAGYVCLSFTTGQVKDGTALRTIQEAMARRSEAA